MKKRCFTKRGYQRLLARKRELSRTLKEAKLKTIPSARSEPGNLWHDNAAFEQAEREVDRLTLLLREVEESLSRAKLVDLHSLPKDKVNIGRKVSLKLDGEEETYQIVGWGEGDPKKGKVSYASAMGKALLGRKRGESVKIKTAQRELTAKITAIT
jgi:transcription elongation factor GreA